MKLLALDTAGSACSVALLWGEARFEAETSSEDAQHTRSLPALVAGVLARAGGRSKDLQGIACGIGPGSFTSLRVGVAYAQGLALAAGCPILGLSSLAMLAHSAGPGHWIAALDARMGEVYVGAYRVTQTAAVERVADEWVGKASEAQTLAVEAWGIVGNGWALYEEDLRRALGIAVPVRRQAGALHARDALALALPRFTAGETISPLDLRPNYLRQRVALTLTEQAQRRAAR